MKTVELGTTGIEVSALPLGTMNYGTTLEKPTVFSLLDRYTEQGGAFIDTANMYAFWLAGDADTSNGGESETVLGRWISERGVRDNIFLASKVGNPTNKEDMANRGPLLTADYVVKECEGSLRRLGTDHLDLYYTHVDDRRTPLEETLEALHRLIRSGKIRYIGASNRFTWRIEQARLVAELHSWPSFCCVQQKFSYLQPVWGQNILKGWPVADYELFDYCRTNKLTILGYEPILKAIYVNRERLTDGRFDYESEDNRRRLKVLDGVARDHGVTPLQIALAWMLHHDPVVLPIVAADTVAQLDEDLAAGEITLGDDEVSRLTNAARLSEVTV